MAPPFELFGPSHLGALFVISGVGAALVHAARRPASSVLVRGAVAAGLVAAVVVYVSHLGSQGRLDPWALLPLHLCDMAILVAVFALLTRHRGASELLFFWTCTGTLLASLTPDLRVGFPSTRFVTYFALHGGVIVAALVLVVGLRRPPRPGAWWRALLATNAYAAAVAVVNLAFGKNYLFLMRKPAGATLLDAMGPWPSYILVAELVAAVGFLILERLSRAGAARPAHAS